MVCLSFLVGDDRLSVPFQNREGQNGGMSKVIVGRQVWTGAKKSVLRDINT